MSLWDRFWRLPAWERAAFCRLAGLQLRAWLALQLFGLEGAVRRFQVSGHVTGFRSLPPGLTPARFTDRCHVLAGALRCLPGARMSARTAASQPSPVCRRALHELRTGLRSPQHGVRPAP